MAYTWPLLFFLLGGHAILSARRSCVKARLPRRLGRARRLAALTPACANSASRRRRKNTNCRGPPLPGQGLVEHNVSSSQEKEHWLGRTSQETLVSLSSTEPGRKT